MNICIVTSSYPRSPDDSINAGVFVRDFARELSHTEHTVCVFTHWKEGARDNKDDGFEVKHFNWFGSAPVLTSLGMRNPIELIRGLSLVVCGRKALLEFVRERAIDACLAMWAVPSGWFAYQAWKRLGVPYSVWCLGSDIWNVGASAPGRWVLRKVLHHAQDLFADGIQLSKDAEEIGGRACMFLPSTRRLPREHSGRAEIDRSKTSFLFIGRFHPHKGPDVLIEAFRIMVQEWTRNVHLYIFGRGEMERSLRERISAYGLDGHVSLGGYATPEMVVDYLRECVCLVIPSRIESIPVVLSDAMQMRTPVVVTDVGDMGTLVTDYRAGMVVPPEDPRALVEALLEFVNCGDELDFSDGIERLSARFDLRCVVRTYLSYLERIPLSSGQQEGTEDRRYRQRSVNAIERF